MRTLLALLLLLPGLAQAIGEPLGPDPDQVWEGNLDYAATAATLLDCTEGTCAGGGHNCQPLNQASATLDVIPVSDTLTIEYAQLNWFASTPIGVGADPEVQLSAPGGAPFPVAANEMLSEGFDDGLPAQQCDLVGILCPGIQECRLTFYSAFADVTAQVEAHRAGGGALNGLWSVSDVTMAGSNEADPSTGIAAIGSLTIGGWSLIVIYRDEDNLPLRRIYYYQGFELNEGQNRTINPRGFRAPPDAAMDLTYHVLEGDQSVSGDALHVNGRAVQDGCNPNNNVFNSTVNTGRADGQCQTGVDGVDLDTFHIDDALEPGDTEAEITYVIPMGDGLFTAGEQIFTNWLVLGFDHLPPDFSDVKPQKRAAPAGGSQVSPGDRIEYIVEITNSGGDFADEVLLFDNAPEGTTYVAGSASIDGRPIVDALGGGCPFANAGFELTSLPEIETVAPGDRHLARFSVTVDDDAEDLVENIAYIETPGVPRAETQPVIHIVVAGEPRADLGVEADMFVAELDAAVAEPDGGTQDAHVEADLPRLTPDSGDNDLCPVGERMVAGECRAICGGGLVFNPACGPAGECRPEAAAQCEAGTANSGCGCRVDGDDSAPLALLGVLLLGLVRRRR
jgi:uncharacterized repeat protein (TIGR01451 family)/MYXO-CTERM domain-containing protein